jgi:hypothetical protein
MLTKILGVVSGLAVLAVLLAGLAGARSAAFAAEREGGGAGDGSNADCYAAHTACMNKCVSSGTIDENCGINCRERLEICKNVILENVSKGITKKGATPNKLAPAAK